MYLYFDLNGTLKEIINDDPLRQGASLWNKIYCYWEGQNDSVTASWVVYEKPDGTRTAQTIQSSIVNDHQIPYDKNRDLRFFKYGEGYKFYVFNVPDVALAVSGAVGVSISYTIDTANPQTAEYTDDSVVEMGLVAFQCERKIVSGQEVGSIAPDEALSVAEWNELKKMVGSYAGAINGKVDKITTGNTNKIYSHNGSTQGELGLNNTLTVSNGNIGLSGQYPGGNVNGNLDLSGNKLSFVSGYLQNGVINGEWQFNSNLPKAIRDNQPIEPQNNADLVTKKYADSLPKGEWGHIEGNINSQTDLINKINPALNNVTISYNGNNVSLNKTNLSGTTLTPEAISLASSSSAGLMSKENVTTLEGLVTRVEALEGQTIRLLYNEKTNPTRTDILNFVIASGYTDRTKYASIAVVVEGTNHVWKWTNDCGLYDGEWIFKDTIHFTVAGITINQDLHQFLSNGNIYKTLKYVQSTNTLSYITDGEVETVVYENDAWVDEEYKTIELVNAQIVSKYTLTFMLSNTDTQQEYIDGMFKDFGVDTVTQFTNEIAGIIKGKNQTGYVYAENDGTGSVVGWDNLVNIVAGKQDILTAGSNVSISNNVISATDTTYTAGTGIDINDNNNISIDTNTVATKTDLQEKQDVLAAGTNISIDSNNVINCTLVEKTYTGGNGININSSDEISIDTNVVATKTDLQSKQDTITAGNGISLSNNVVSADTSVLATQTDILAKAKKVYVTQNNNSIEIGSEYDRSGGGTDRVSAGYLQLADSSKVGLMSSSDFTSLSQLRNDVANLKNQTIRLLYTASQTPTAQQIKDFVVSKGYTDVAQYGGIAVVVSGTYHIWHWYNEPIDLTNGLQTGIYNFPLNTTQVNYGISQNIDFTSNGANYSSISSIYDSGTYKLKYDNTIVASQPTAVGAVATWTDNNYVSIIVNTAIASSDLQTQFKTFLTTNIIVGAFRDDGVDTVANFTNTTAGVIKGSQTEGKVFAENDGTGSVYGWDALNTTVNNKQDLINDLSAIRSGASAGTTAVQPTTLNNYATTTALNNGLATKQDTISDLGTIRNGASLGSTAVQPATLNNYLPKQTPVTNSIYLQQPNGTVDMLPCNESTNTHGIPYRTGTGNIYTAIPFLADHCTNKNYVDYSDLVDVNLINSCFCKTDTSTHFADIWVKIDPIAYAISKVEFDLEITSKNALAGIALFALKTNNNLNDIREHWDWGPYFRNDWYAAGGWGAYRDNPTDLINNSGAPYGNLNLSLSRCRVHVTFLYNSNTGEVHTNIEQMSLVDGYYGDTIRTLYHATKDGSKTEPIYVAIGRVDSPSTVASIEYKSMRVMRGRVLEYGALIPNYSDDFLIK